MWVTVVVDLHPGEKEAQIASSRDSTRGGVGGGVRGRGLITSKKLKTIIKLTICLQSQA